MASTRKGKVARGAWAGIANRHAKGESLASIARDFNCTAPAIRYILNRHPQSKTESGSDSRSTRVPVGAQVTCVRRAVVVPPEELLERGAGIRRDDDVVPRNVRARVTNDVAAFLVALDDLRVSASPDRIEILRGATDYVLRSVAHVLLSVNKAARDGDNALPEVALERRRV
jgi:transposase-like protein